MGLGTPTAHFFCSRSTRILNPSHGIASLKKAGLEADIARLERLRAARDDDLYAIRREIRECQAGHRGLGAAQGRDQQGYRAARSHSRRAFTMVALGASYTERKEAGAARRVPAPVGFYQPPPGRPFRFRRRTGG